MKIHDKARQPKRLRLALALALRLVATGAIIPIHANSRGDAEPAALPVRISAAGGHHRIASSRASEGVRIPRGIRLRLQEGR